MLGLKLSVLIFLLHSATATDERNEELNTTGPIYKILVTHPEVPQSGMDVLKNKNLEVVVCQSVPPKREEILEKIKGVHGLYWASDLNLNAEVLDAAGSQLKSISTMSENLDFVDMEEIKKRNIPLGYALIGRDEPELAIGLMIAAARRFKEATGMLEKSMNWKNYHIQGMAGPEIRGSTVGFFGFGFLPYAGQAIMERLSGFRVERFLYTASWRIEESREKILKLSWVSMDEMLAQCDFIFVIEELNQETAGFFNSTAFAKMKRTAVLIDVSAGYIVNKDDLYDALKSGQILGAAIDNTYPDNKAAKLMTLPNCLVTPNLSIAEEDVISEMAFIAALNVLGGLAEEYMLIPAYDFHLNSPKNQEN